MDYTFAIASRNRPQVSTLAIIRPLGKDIAVFVDTEEERLLYKAQNPDINVIVTGTKGIQNARNFILSYYGYGERIVFMCDDVQEIQKLQDGVLVEVKGPELAEFIETAFNQADKFGTKLWGVYPIPNSFYMSNTLSPNTFIIGTFCGVVISDIRCDKEMPLKEDYDFTIKHILAHKKVLRYNNYCVRAKHYTNKGGAVDYRNDETEGKAIHRLIELYPGIVRPNPRRPNEILLNFKRSKC